MNYDGTLSPLGFCAADMIKMDHGPTADALRSWSGFWSLFRVLRRADNLILYPTEQRVATKEGVARR